MQITLTDEEIDRIARGEETITSVRDRKALEREITDHILARMQRLDDRRPTMIDKGADRRLQAFLKHEAAVRAAQQAELDQRVEAFARQLLSQFEAFDPDRGEDIEAFAALLRAQASLAPSRDLAVYEKAVRKLTAAN